MARRRGHPAVALFAFHFKGFRQDEPIKNLFCGCLIICIVLGAIIGWQCRPTIGPNLARGLKLNPTHNDYFARPHPRQESLLESGKFENRSALARYLGVSRARVTQVLKRLT